MSSSYKTIHWGLLLLAFNFYLDNINILPDFLGFILISKGLGGLIYESYHTYFERARRISNIMIGISLVQYILNMNMNMKGEIINFTRNGVGLFVASNFIALLSLAIIYNILKGIYIEAENRGLIEFMRTIKNSWNSKLVVSLGNLLLCAFIINGYNFILNITPLFAIIAVIVQVWVAMVVKRAGEEIS